MPEPRSTQLDFTPVAAHLQNHYQGDPKEAAAQLYAVSQYLIRVPDPTDTASYLRELLAVVNGLAAAFDSMPVQE